jgi:hypothetical protein
MALFSFRWCDLLRKPARPVPPAHRAILHGADRVGVCRPEPSGVTMRKRMLITAGLAALFATQIVGAFQKEPVDLDGINKIKAIGLSPELPDRRVRSATDRIAQYQKGGRLDRCANESVGTRKRRA